MRPDLSHLADGRRLDLLARPATIAALVLLAVNDHVLKAAFGGVVTGKLSDFAGLYLFAVFCIAVSRTPSPGRTCALVAAAWVAWKTPLSQPILDAWNGAGIFRLHRVADPADLLALAVLPFAWRAARRPRRPYRRIIPIAVVPACLLAFAATDRFAIPVMAPTPPTYFPEPRESLLTRIYRLHLDVAATAPWRMQEDRPDTVRVQLAPRDGPGAARSAPPWAGPALAVEVADAPGGGTSVRLLSGAALSGSDPETLRWRYREDFLEPLRRNQPAPDTGGYAEPAGNDRAFRPRILAPRSVTAPRAEVRVSLARPAYVAVIEVAPDSTSRVIFPAGDEPYRAPAGESVLRTSCAAVSSRRWAVDERVPPCGVAVPATPRDVARVYAGYRLGMRDPLQPGLLALIASDEPLRRAGLEASLRTAPLGIHSWMFDQRPLRTLVSSGGGRHWAASRTWLRR